MNSVAPSFEGEHIGAGEAALLLFLAVVGFCVNLLDGHPFSLSPCLLFLFASSTKGVIAKRHSKHDVRRGIKETDFCGEDHEGERERHTWDPPKANSHCAWAHSTLSSQVPTHPLKWPN